jgi:hypothetical protein
MTREFILLPEFDRQIKNSGLNDDDIIVIENVLLENPAVGDVIQGTGGIRKCRIALSDNNSGKSGGARVIYLDLPYYARIYLITVYTKSAKENLSKAERNALKDLTKMLESEARKRGK